MSEEKRYGWIREDGESLDVVYLDMEGKEVYVSGVCNSPTDNPFHCPAYCIGEVGAFVRNNRADSRDFIKRLGQKMPRDRILLIGGDHSGTELRVLAAVAAGREGAARHVGLIKGLPRIADTRLNAGPRIEEDLAKVSLKPLMSRKGPVTNISLVHKFEEMAFPDEEPEPEEPSVAPPKGKKRRFPVPR